LRGAFDCPKDRTQSHRAAELEQDQNRISIQSCRVLTGRAHRGSNRSTSDLNAVALRLCVQFFLAIEWAGEWTGYRAGWPVGLDAAPMPQEHRGDHRVLR
jgi:hypothetical protein